MAWFKKSKKSKKQKQEELKVDLIKLSGHQRNKEVEQSMEKIVKKLTVEDIDVMRTLMKSDRVILDPSSPRVEGLNLPVDMPELQQPASNQPHEPVSKTERILNELLDTETDFVNDLMTMVKARKVVHTAMLNSPNITDKEIEKVKRLLSIVESLQNIHKELEALFKNLKIYYLENQTEEAQKALEQIKIMSRFSNAYTTDYIILFDEVNEILQPKRFATKKENNLWAAIMDQYNQLDNDKQLGPPGYLIKPIQRPPKYELLFRELNSELDAEHVLSEDVSAMFDYYKGLNHKINEAKRNHEKGQILAKYIDIKQSKKLRAKSNLYYTITGSGLNKDECFDQLMDVNSVNDYHLSVQKVSGNPDLLVVRNAAGNRIAEVEYNPEKNDVKIKARRKYLNYDELEAINGLVNHISVDKKQIEIKSQDKNLNELGSLLNQSNIKQQVDILNRNAINITSEMVLVENNYLDRLETFANFEPQIIEALESNNNIDSDMLKTVQDMINLTKNIIQTNLVLRDEMQGLHQAYKTNDLDAIEKHLKTISDVRQISELYHAQYSSKFSLEFMSDPIKAMQICQILQKQVYDQYASTKMLEVNGELMAAVQRFPRYGLLFKELEQKTPQDSPLHDITSQLRKEFENSTGRINQRIKDDEGQLQALKELESGPKRISKKQNKKSNKGRK